MQQPDSGNTIQPSRLSLTTLLLSGACLLGLTNAAEAAKTITINATNQAGLLDGRCGGDEWDAATQIALPAQASLFLMHDKEYFYFCAAGKAQDHTVLDLYIEHPQTGHLHHFHLSAQMGEKIRTQDGWGESATWDLKDYAGFWVPYFGLEDPENRANPKFARGTHRQMQIARKKFPGESWKMMVGVSAIEYEGERAEFFYPQQATENDTSSWVNFSFSE